MPTRRISWRTRSNGWSGPTRCGRRSSARWPPGRPARPPAARRPLAPARPVPRPPAPPRPTRARPAPPRPARTRPARTRPARTRPTRTRPAPPRLATPPSRPRRPAARPGGTRRGGTRPGCGPVTRVAPPSAARPADGDPGRPGVRVFLLDDHEIVRRGVRELLEAEPDIAVVGEAGTAQGALDQVPALRPDVAVLDVRLPDGDGVSVCRALRSQTPGTACLMLTSFGDEEALLKAVMAGAAGYVLKQIRGTDLVGAVRTVASGQSMIPP